MPSYAYDDDVELEAEGLSDADIRAEDDIEQLCEWAAQLEDLGEDIRAQLDGYQAAGLNNLPWVYRACQKLGFLGRTKARLQRRLRALGHEPNPFGRKIEELNRKIQSLRSESGVAVEFMRLALPQLSHRQFSELESAAVHALAQRLAKGALEGSAEGVAPASVERRSRDTIKEPVSSLSDLRSQG